MATISQMVFSNAFSDFLWKKKFWIKISLKFVSEGPIGSNPALV